MCFMNNANLHDVQISKNCERRAVDFNLSIYRVKCNFFNYRFWFSEVRNLEKNRPFYLYILHAERKNSIVVLSKPKNCPLTWVFWTSLKKFFTKRVHGCCHVHAAVIQKLDLQKRLKEISAMHLVAERLILHFLTKRVHGNFHVVATVIWKSFKGSMEISVRGSREIWMHPKSVIRIIYKYVTITIIIAMFRRIIC